MDLDEFRENGGHAYVVGISFPTPPRYARFRERHPSGWEWTGELTEAETFPTGERAAAHLRGDMAPFVAGTNARVLKVEMKVRPA